MLKAHVGRWSEDCPEHQGVVVYSMNDTPLVSFFFFFLEIGKFVLPPVRFCSIEGAIDVSLLGGLGGGANGRTQFVCLGVRSHGKVNG